MDYIMGIMAVTYYCHPGGFQIMGRQTDSRVPGPERVGSVVLKHGSSGRH